MGFRFTAAYASFPTLLSGDVHRIARLHRARLPDWTGLPFALPHPCCIYQHIRQNMVKIQVPKPPATNEQRPPVFPSLLVCTPLPPSCSQKCEQSVQISSAHMWFPSYMCPTSEQSSLSEKDKTINKTKINVFGAYTKTSSTATFAAQLMVLH